MASNHFDLTTEEVGDPTLVLKSPLDEPVSGLVTAEDFHRPIKCVSMLRLARRWHPRVSKNGNIPRTMGKAKIFVCIAETQPGLAINAD